MRAATALHYNVCIVRAALHSGGCLNISLQAGAAIAAMLLAANAAGQDLAGKSIGDLNDELVAKRTTSEALVKAYQQRIESLDRSGPQLQAVLSINPDAQKHAMALDRERKRRGVLHGIPILIKDNIETADPLPTTAGSLALLSNVTGRDAPIVAGLRAAGAVVLGKSNLSEWANYRSDRSISGWSAVGGLTKNPHVLDRSACGSSAGSAAAVAAGLAAAAIGTETDGSIVCPASMNGIVGLKPTHGLLSIERIVPIAHSQDTPGPMARSVADAAILLHAMAGTKGADYVQALRAASLAGKRIGVWRFAPGRWPQIDPVYERALGHLRSAGATLVEVAVPDTSEVGAAERIVLNTEFRPDLNAWLATTPQTVKTRSLEQLIAFNRSEPREMVIFGQETFERANSNSIDEATYRATAANARRLASEAIDRTLQEHRLDLIVAPTVGPAWRIDFVNGDQFPGSFSTLPAVSGYPHLTVPMGTWQDLPLGLSFVGPRWSDAELLAAGHVFEQRAGRGALPGFRASIEAEDPRRLPQRVRADAP